MSTLTLPKCRRGMDLDEAGAGSASSAASGEGAGLRKDAAASLPWVEKYRPDSLTDLVSQGDIVSTCALAAAAALTEPCRDPHRGQNLLASALPDCHPHRTPPAVTRLIQANRLPHLLFYGPPGTGKTSTVLALAKQLYGSKWRSMTLEVSPRARHVMRSPGVCSACSVRPWDVGAPAAPLQAAVGPGVGCVVTLHPHAPPSCCRHGVCLAHVCSSTPPMTAASTWCETRSSHSLASAARWRVGRRQRAPPASPPGWRLRQRGKTGQPLRCHGQRIHAS